MSRDFNIQNLHGHIFSWCAVSGLAGGLLVPITGVLPNIGVIYIAKAFITVISGLCHTGGHYLCLGSSWWGEWNNVYITGPTFGEVALLFTAIILLRLCQLALRAVSLERANNATLWNF